MPIDRELLSGETALDQLQMSVVQVSSILAGESPRRRGLDDEHMRLLVQVPASQLPPILIHRHTSRVIDGMHRLEAARLRGDETILARFVDCSEDEAFLLAVRTNTSHGLPLSLTDRVAAAKRIVLSHPGFSNRAVATITGLDGKTVAGIRRRSAEQIPQLKDRIGRDGRRRPVNGAEGRRRASELIAAHPTASLREIAKKAGISPGTVADVRHRMSQGEDPLPRRLRAADKAVETPSPSRPSALSRQVHNKPLTWPGIRAKLIKDPSLRYPESGRAFLQWMDAHATGLQEWTEISLEAIPQYWLEMIAALARSCSAEWSSFADELEKRREVTSRSDRQ